MSFLLRRWETRGWQTLSAGRTEDFINMRGGFSTHRMKSARFLTQVQMLWPQALLNQRPSHCQVSWKQRVTCKKRNRWIQRRFCALSQWITRCCTRFYISLLLPDWRYGCAKLFLRNCRCSVHGEYRVVSNFDRGHGAFVCGQLGRSRWTVHMGVVPMWKLNPWAG